MSVGRYCSLKLWECGECELDAWVMEASIGGSGRQTRTSRNRQGPHRPAAALNTTWYCGQPDSYFLVRSIKACVACCLDLKFHENSRFQMV